MEHRGNRHGRSEQARQSVLHAADDLLAEKGFAALTIEGIAARAGVAKQTIYRWWPSKTDVLMDAFVQDSAEDLEPRDTGTLAGDLREYLTHLAAYLTESDAGAVFRALTGQAQHDPALAARLREEHLTHQRARDRRPFERAVARGELPAVTDLNMLVDRLVGPVYYRVLVTGEPVDADLVEALVAACAPGTFGPA